MTIRYGHAFLRPEVAFNEQRPHGATTTATTTRPPWLGHKLRELATTKSLSAAKKNPPRREKEDTWEAIFAGREGRLTRRGAMSQRATAGPTEDRKGRRLELLFDHLLQMDAQ